VCSLCKVGFHAECLAGLGAATPSQKELEDQRDGTGEWHCPVCSEANMDLWTCWMPLGDIPADPSYSRLMVLPGSHLLQGGIHSTGGGKSQQKPWPQQRHRVSGGASVAA